MNLYQRSSSAFYAVSQHTRNMTLTRIYKAKYFCGCFRICYNKHACSEWNYVYCFKGMMQFLWYGRIMPLINLCLGMLYFKTIYATTMGTRVFRNGAVTMPGRYHEIYSHFRAPTAIVIVISRKQVDSKKADTCPFEDRHGMLGWLAQVFEV